MRCAHWEFIESETKNKGGETWVCHKQKRCASQEFETHCPAIRLSELPAYPKSSRHWCCTDCGRTGRSAPWMTLWRNTWATSPSKTPWGRRETRSWNTWRMASYSWTAGRFRSAPRQSPCVGWPASSQVHTEGYTGLLQIAAEHLSCGVAQDIESYSEGWQDLTWQVSGYVAWYNNGRITILYFLFVFIVIDFRAEIIN